jgi:hypothetical protein
MVWPAWRSIDPSVPRAKLTVQRDDQTFERVAELGVAALGGDVPEALDPLLMREAECDSGENGDERRENHAGSDEAKVVAVAYR